MTIENQAAVTRGRLNGEQRHKLRKLLYMQYTPRELAEELGINKRQFYNVYLPLGCPHEKDSRGHIWIVGTHFQEWYLETYKKRKLAKNEIYCVSCKKAVPMVNPVEHNKEGLIYSLCECPECKNTVAKIITMRKG